MAGILEEGPVRKFLRERQRYGLMSPEVEIPNFIYIVTYSKHTGMEPRENIVAVYSTEDLARKRVEEAKSFGIDMQWSKWRVRLA